MAIITHEVVNMDRTRKIITVMLIFTVSFGAGVLSSRYKDELKGLYQQAALKVFNYEGLIVEGQNLVIQEQAFTRCRHIVTSVYPDANKLSGKNLNELKEMLPYEKGYLIWQEEDGSLIIHQRVEDWCPEDREKVHIGILNDYVTVFRGPGGIDDEIIRTTKIKAATIPHKLKQTMEAGILEFGSEEQADFVLDNLDEYE